MAFPNRRAWGQGKLADGPTTSGTIPLADAPGAQDGDILVATLGIYDQAATPSLPAWVTVQADSGQDGTNSPRILVLWWRIDTEAGHTDVPVSLAVASSAGYTVTAWEGDTVDRGDPVAATAQPRGQTSSPGVTNPTFGPLWTSPEDDGQAEVAGMGFIVHRAQASAAGLPNAWDTDASGWLIGSADFSGLRSRRGYTHAAGSGARVASYGFPAASLDNPNAWSATAAYVVQGLQVPKPLTPVDPAFTWAQDPDGLTVQFTDRLANVDGNDASWSWDFGDGSTSTVQDPSHRYTLPGTYSVTLQATNPQGQSALHELNVPVAAPPPVAAWSWEPVPDSLAVRFLDRSRRAHSLLWTFAGGPAGTTEPRPLVTFPAEGDYLVRLEATNSAGTTHLDRTIHVRRRPALPARQDGLLVLVGAEVDGEFRDMTCDVVESSWNWGADDDLGVLTVPSASRLLLRVRDPGRLLDPTNPWGPWYGSWDIASRMRLSLASAADPGTLYPVWVGEVTDLQHDLVEATILGDDDVAPLARYELDVEGDVVLQPGTVAAQADALLDLAGFPRSRRDLEPGGQALVGTSVRNESVWEALGLAARTALGRLQFTQDGLLAYDGRDTAWADGEPDLILGCTTPQGDPADAGISALAFLGRTRAMRNYLRVGREGGPDSLYRDGASVDRFGRFPGVATDLLLPDDDAAAHWAQFVLDRQARPSWGARQVRFRVAPDILARVARARMGDFWRVVDDTHGALIDVKARLLGLEYTVDAWSVWASAWLAEDPGLAVEESEVILDTDADLAGAHRVRADNVTTSGTGADAVLVLDQAEPAAVVEPLPPLPDDLVNP